MKPLKTSHELNLLVSEAVHAIEVVAEGGNTDPASHSHVGPVYMHPRDDQGRNWDISAGRNLGPFTGAVAKVVDPLRDQYDLAEAKALAPGA